VKHEDHEEVELRYSSNQNITFNGTLYPGYTWGEWRELTEEQRDTAIENELWELVDIYVDAD